MRQRFPPPHNPMAALFRRAAESLATSLTAHSAHYYQCTGATSWTISTPNTSACVPSGNSAAIRTSWTGSPCCALASLPWPDRLTDYVIRLRRILEELAWAKEVPLLTRLDHHSLINYTIMVSSILYFQRNTTGATLISSKY
jgi:hypothetical protein